MNIEFTKAYIADGTPYATLEEAQLAALRRYFPPDVTWTRDTIAGAILDNSHGIIDILTTTTRSRPKARKTNGGKKTRRASVTVLEPGELLPTEA